ncbi:methyl-galactoside ABC transporter ATPase [Gammaproteobacteria bacterium]|nr:methyl-galactoside ABC transporter ATPase [Gammaproteobacteria bacterium]
MTLLEMKHITKTFPGVKALDNVSLTVNEGEVHALLGENGAGKSTLMKVLSGVYQADSGEIYIDDQKVNIADPLAAQKHKISMIHQEFNLFPHLSIAENIFIGREFCSIENCLLDTLKQNNKTLELLNKLGLDLDPTMLVSELTVAEQQMIEIAKALSIDARILVMDEPTAALTEKEILKLFEIIHQLTQNKVGIIYISHRLEELTKIAHRATVMRDGQYIKTVDYKADIIDDLIAAMVGRELGNIYPKKTSLNTSISSEILFEVKNLTRGKRFTDINFILNKGEILGFSGLMGAGRTEVSRAIFGADPYDSGEFYLNGKKIMIRSVSEAIEHKIAYLTEDRKKDGLALGLAVGTNIMLSSYAQYSSFAWLVDEDRCTIQSEALRQKLKIKTPHLDQQAGLLSGGNQQKIIIAKWLTCDADIFIFDEPTRGIDVGAKREIYELMQSLTARGKSIIMISSEMPELLGMCDRILVMRNGRITKELSQQEANQEVLLKYATLEIAQT